MQDKKSQVILVFFSILFVHLPVENEVFSENSWTVDAKLSLSGESDPLHIRESACNHGETELRTISQVAICLLAIDSVDIHL